MGVPAGAKFDPLSDPPIQAEGSAGVNWTGSRLRPLHRSATWRSDCNSSRLIPREEVGSGASARVILVIDVTKRLTAVVADDEACAVVFDVPRRREAAICHRLSQPIFPLKPDA